jgi:hypothetical protein
VSAVGEREQHERNRREFPSASGFGVIAHIAGLDLPDGTHRGVLRLVDDPQEAERLCAALTTG